MLVTFFLIQGLPMLAMGFPHRAAKPSPAQPYVRTLTGVEK